MMKKICSILLMAVLLIGMMPAQASAASVSPKTGDQGVFMFVLMAALCVAGIAGNVYIKERK